MTDIQLLKSKMAANGDNFFMTKLSKVLGVTKPTAIRRLSGDECFTQKDIRLIKERYHLSPDEVDEIFLRG